MSINQEHAGGANLRACHLMNLITRIGDHSTCPVTFVCSHAILLWAFKFSAGHRSTLSAYTMVHLVVRQLDGSSFGVHVGADSTVLELLQLIAAAADEKASALRLVHGGQLLPGAARLSDHAICDSTALTLLKEGGTSIRAPGRPIGLPPPAPEVLGRPPLGDGRSKASQHAQDALLSSSRTRPVPDSVHVLWIDGSAMSVPVSDGAATTVEQLKTSFVRVAGVASLAPAQLALFYAGTLLGDAQALGVGGSECVCVCMVSPHPLAAPLCLQDLPLSDGGSLLFHAVPVEVPLSEQFGWPCRPDALLAASRGGPGRLRVHCPECGVAGAVWELALTCALCAEDHEAVLVLSGTTPADAALRQVGVERGARVSGLHDVLSPQVSMGRGSDDPVAEPRAPYSYADLLALSVRCFQCGGQGMVRGPGAGLEPWGGRVWAPWGAACAGEGEALGDPLPPGPPSFCMQPRVGFRCRACVVPASAIQTALPAVSAAAAGGGALATLAASAGGAGAVRWLGVPDARDASAAAAVDELEGALVLRVPSSAVSTVFVAQGPPGLLATGGPVIAALARQGSGAAAAVQVQLELREGDAGAWACESGGGPALAHAAPASGRLRASSSAAALLQVMHGGSIDIPVKGGGGRASPAAGAPAAAAALDATAAAAAEDEPLPPLPPCPEGGQAPSLADRDPADFSGAVASLPADIGGRAPLRRLLAPAVLGPDVATAAATLGAALLQALGRPHAGALQARY